MDKRNSVKFEALVRNHARRMYHIAYARLGHHDDAQDVVQEAFTRAYGALESLKQEESGGAWLARIVINLINSRRRQIEAVYDESAFESLEDPRPGPEDLALIKEQAIHLNEALKLLPEALLTPLILREFGDLSYEEMASALQVPIGTVMSRLFRARTFLRKKVLAEELQVADPVGEL